MLLAKHVGRNPLRLQLGPGTLQESLGKRQTHLWCDTAPLEVEPLEVGEYFLVDRGIRVCLQDAFRDLEKTIKNWRSRRAIPKTG